MNLDCVDIGVQGAVHEEVDLWHGGRPLKSQNDWWSLGRMCCMKRQNEFM